MLPKMTEPMSRIDKVAMLVPMYFPPIIRIVGGAWYLFFASHALACMTFCTTILVRQQTGWRIRRLMDCHGKHRSVFLNIGVGYPT